MEANTVPKRSLCVAILLTLASICHMAAVILPFVEMRALLSTETYGLIPSTLMLWRYGMQGLALLVIAFSIVFPFAKLLVLWLAWAAPRPGTWLGRLVGVAETLGRWSMLDVFLILLLLVVTSGEVLVATRPLVGVICFLVGVVCTMSAGAMIALRMHPTPAGAPAAVRGGGVHILHFVSAVALLAAQFIPLLETTSMLVSNQDFSVYGMAWELAHNGMPLAALVIGVFLIVLPWIALLSQWFAMGGRPWLRTCAGILRYWVMLDVFALALVLFVAESRTTVPSRLAVGAVILALAIVLHGGAVWLARRRMAQAP